MQLIAVGESKDALITQHKVTQLCFYEGFDFLTEPIVPKSINIGPLVACLHLCFNDGPLDLRKSHRYKRYQENKVTLAVLSLRACLIIISMSRHPFPGFNLTRDRRRRGS